MNERPAIYRCEGAGPLDDVYDFDVPGEGNVMWNVTRLTRAALAGEFGQPVENSFDGMPTPNYENLSREKIDLLKRFPGAALSKPAIAVELPGGGVMTFADGNHRLTALRELGHATYRTYVVPNHSERRFRVTIKELP